MSLGSSVGYLSESLCEDISFLPFFPPPSPASEGWSRWVESLEAIDYDLRYLLQLPHDRFWSQALYDKSLSTLLDSFLQRALRPHEAVWSVPDKVLELLRNIHRRVFMTFLRLSTHKEDQARNFSPEVFGNLIHTHSLFTVPRLLDLCSIYGNSNAQLLFKMVDNVFSKQPQFSTDLYSVMNVNVREALGKLVEKSNITESSNEVFDLVLYLSDITHSLSSLIAVYPPASPILCKAGVIESLVNCYEVAVPILKLKLKQHKAESSPHIVKCFQLLRANTCRIVHSLLMSCCHGDERRAGSEDQVLASISVIASGKMFHKEFEKHFSLKVCFQSLKEVYPNLDDTQLQYMLAETVSEVQPTSVPAATKQKYKGKAPNVKESVNYIKEMLPHLEEDFIKDCLKEYHYNQEVVIHHILEGTLAPHLLPSVEDEEAPPTENTPLVLEEGQSILEARLGAYDYDEFDVFRRDDVDLSKIHIGKKFESARDILSDKSHVRYMKGVGLDLINYDEYDDEYDDTYDSHNIGSLDQDNTDDMFTVKRLNEKGQFSSRRHKWGGADDDQDEETEVLPVQPVQPVKLLQRPVTPEKIRKEKNASKPSSPLFKQKQQKGGAKRPTDQSKREGGGAKNKKAELKQEEGKPSKAERKEERAEQWSKEQSESVTKSGTEKQRQFNERHKSSRANHNRKALADKKRGGAYH